MLPAATHDLTAARTHGLIDAPTTEKVMTFADKGPPGTPYSLGVSHTSLTKRGAP
jgi:hypothetical protein